MVLLTLTQYADCQLELNRHHHRAGLFCIQQDGASLHWGAKKRVAIYHVIISRLALALALACISQPISAPLSAFSLWLL